MQDLTTYLAGPSEPELEYLLGLYGGICPADRLLNYKIAELQSWCPIAKPVLTASARAAAAAGARQPYLEPVRQRIREGRAFELQLWDGRSIDDPEGSWSFNCRCIHLRATGLHAFARIVVPLQAESAILLEAARAIADNVALYSGHGGLAFLHDPLLYSDAMDVVYAQARRFWGVDVEDLRGTLPLMRTHLKSVNWITMVGDDLESGAVTDKLEAALNELAVAGVTIERHRHARVLIAGPQPVAGDQHRPDHSLDPYYAVAKALEPLFLTEHPDFPGERFITNGNTVGWIRRFLEPSGWR